MVFILIVTNNTVDLDDEDALVRDLQYDSLYDLAVCISCGYALPLEWIAKHFKEIHKLNND